MMTLNEQIVLVVRETGWTLEYIRSQPIDYIWTLVSEISFQQSIETYQAAYNSALVVCALINSNERHYKPEDIIGHLPERRDRAINEELGQNPQIETVALPNGKTYKLWPLTVNMLCEIQQKVGKESIASMSKGVPDFEIIRMMFYLRARHYHPEVTLEDAGEMALTEMNKLGV